MPSIQVSTIIVSFNTAQLTCQAIESVLKNYHDDHIAGEIIVVDNNSSDESPHIIQKKFGAQVRVIANTDNKGFSAANNQGIAQAKGQFYFLLNSDTILGEHVIQHFLHIMTKHQINEETALLTKNVAVVDKIGILTCKLLTPDGQIQPQGGALPNLGNILAWWLWPLPGYFPLLPLQHHYQIQTQNFFNTARPMGWVSGTALFIRRELVEEIGGLDDSIFMYGEDVEYCLRARQHHWDIFYTPDVSITHFGSASSSSAHSLRGEVRGILHVAKKHFSSINFFIIKRVLQFGTLLRWLIFGILFNNGEKKALYSQIAQEISSFN